MPTISTSQLPPPSCWEEFELISADLLSKEWNDPNVQANGRRGQRQNGVDIRGRNGGTPAGAQCKGKRKWPPKRLTTAEIIREVEKAKAYRPKLSTYMILTTDENDAVLQRFVDELNEHHAASSLFQVQLWGWPEIRRRIENDSGLIRKHYGFVSQAEVLEAVAAMPAEIARLIEALQRPMTIGDAGLQVETTEIASELLIAPERKIMAIDLGTTGARVACIIAGRPIVMEDALGHGKMPSVTGFTPDGRVLVGESGRRLATDFPENVVYAAKRLIGRRYSDPVIQELRRYVPFKIVESDSGDAWIEVLGQAWSPSQICRPVLEKLRQTASRWLRFDVRKAMIAVPAHYNEAQRAAMRDAAQLAGWEVIRMVSEPTAAAIFHGHGRDDQISVVYDFGGGTFDVSVVDSSLGVKRFYRPTVTRFWAVKTSTCDFNLMS
ncbi:Hsp70 family protein [Rhizobium daejeonense]